MEKRVKTLVRMALQGNLRTFEEYLVENRSALDLLTRYGDPEKDLDKQAVHRRSLESAIETGMSARAVIQRYLDELETA
jgi:hypothetical protein